MSVDPEKPFIATPEPAPMTIDFGAFGAAPKFYSQQAVIGFTEREAMITFGVMTPFPVENDSPAFVPSSVCFFSIPHFRELVQKMSEQLDLYDKSVGAQNAGR